MERPFRSVAPQRPRWNTRRCRWTMRIVCPHWARSSRYVDNVEKFCRRVSVDVRFTPESGHGADMPACPLCAKSGQTHRSKLAPVSAAFLQFLVGPQHGGGRDRRNDLTGSYDRTRVVRDIDVEVSMHHLV